jgi:hypothetical protein
VLAPGRSDRSLLRITATGNVPIAPSLVLDVPTGLLAELERPGAPVAPGQRATLALEVRALGGEGDLPSLRNVVVRLAPSPFEQSRGLAPASRRLQVTVTPAGTESLARLFARASSLADHELADAAAALYGAVLECDLATVQARLRALADILENSYGATERAEALRARADGLEDCADLADDPIVVDDLADLRRGPNLAATVVGPREVRYGEVVELSGRVINDGDETAGDHRAVLTANGVVLHAEDVPALEPGQAHDFAVRWEAVLLGTVLLGIDADTAGAVEEFTESDNRAAVGMRVLPADGGPVDNRPPAFLNELPTTLLAGRDLEHAIEIDDPDGDAYLLQLVERAPGLRIVDDALVGAVRRPGHFAVTVVAIDRWGASSTQSVDLQVTLREDPNASPRITSRPARALVVDRAWSYVVEAVDDDGDDVVLSLEGPDGASLTDGVVNWTPTQAGVAWLVVTASDPRGAVDVQRFAVSVRGEPLGPDLVVLAMDASEVTEDDDGNRAGLARVTVANQGDTAAAASALRAYDVTEYGTAVVPVVPAGGRVVVELPIDGRAAFPGNLTFVTADADEEVAEADETNNTWFQGQLRAPDAHILVGYRLEDAQLTLMATQSTAYRVLDPVTGESSAEGTLEAFVPTVVTPASDHFVVESADPLQAYLIHEIFAPDFGGDFFHRGGNHERADPDPGDAVRGCGPGVRLRPADCRGPRPTAGVHRSGRRS